MCSFLFLARHTLVNLGQSSVDNNCHLGLRVLWGEHCQKPAHRIMVGTDRSFWVLPNAMVLSSLKWRRKKFSF